MKLPPITGYLRSIPQVLQRALVLVGNDLSRVINGNISFGNLTDGTDNITGFWYSGVTPNPAGTEFQVTHNLGRVPTGWLVVNADQACSVYKGATVWTTSKMYLKCSAATVNLVIFVI